jgi:hypothetical protein
MRRPLVRPDEQTQKMTVYMTSGVRGMQRGEICAGELNQD